LYAFRRETHAAFVPLVVDVVLGLLAGLYKQWS
jgi:hypothetical protein